MHLLNTLEEKISLQHAFHRYEIHLLYAETLRRLFIAYKHRFHSFISRQRGGATGGQKSHVWNVTGELWLVNEIFLSARNNLIGRLCAFMRVGNPPCGFVLYFYRGTQDYIFSFAAKISFMSYKSPVLLRVFHGLKIIRNNQ